MVLKLRRRRRRTVLKSNKHSDVIDVLLISLIAGFRDKPCRLQGNGHNNWWSIPYMVYCKPGAIGSIRETIHECIAVGILIGTSDWSSLEIFVHFNLANIINTVPWMVEMHWQFDSFMTHIINHITLWIFDFYMQIINPNTILLLIVIVLNVFIVTFLFLFFN